MYRALSTSKQVASTSSRGALRATRRRLATDAAPEPKKKRRVFRRIIWTTTAITGTFYVGSTFIAFNNQAYYDLFSDRVPLGQSMLEFAEVRGWDTLTMDDVVDASRSAVVTVTRLIQDTFSEKPAERTKPEPTARPATVIKPEEALRIQTLPPTPQPEAQPPQAEKKEAAQDQKPTFSDEVQELVKKVEVALAKDSETAVPTPAPIESKETNIYNMPLPVGFEPPPGYKRPPTSKKEEPKPSESPEPDAAPVKLPLVAPAVEALNETEPIITHLAGTIDNLASYVSANPKSATKAADFLEEAKVELTSLAERIEKVREEERVALEAKLDEQTREYSLKLIELEMEAQDKLDHQEEDFRKFFEEERTKMIDGYRQKLEQELKTQTELINERLKEEVIAQGIELQRRWIREIKVRVEQERGGRLAKLEELSANLKRLEQIALDNSEILDDNIRIHALWSAARALSNTALDSLDRKPFRDELRVLRHIAAARDDELVSTVLETLESSDVPDIGVEPLADLTIWFTTSVYPKVAQVALVPDQNAGVLSYLTSRVLSSFRFKRQGLVEGEDILSVLARAEFYLNEQNLDSATRELNQLKGPAKTLLNDWLEAARRRLEVQQALDVVQTQATLTALLVV
ncbi:hypothetical protein AX15_004147 [Amanita polypyramis BW_CC]|nr:hypothetical protein AX15_004147 [Amanita polypyramis BW_CC]